VPVFQDRFSSFVGKIALSPDKEVRLLNDDLKLDEIVGSY
jgi:hypothetical protein